MATAVSFQAFQAGLYWLTFQLTGSPLFLGVVGAANAVPTIILTLLGGVAADKIDKRHLLIATSLISAMLMVALALLTLTEWVEVWHLILMAVLKGSVSAFDIPIRNAIYPSVMDRSAWTSGVALDSSVWWSTSIIAPTIAGFVISLAGTEAVFFMAGGGMLISATLMYLLRMRPVAQELSTSTARLMLNGVKFIRRDPTIAFLLSMGFYASFFGNSYIALIPVFAVDIFDVGPQGFGLLLGANSVGAVVTSVWVGYRGNFRRRSLLLIGGVAFAGLAVAVFGFSAELIGSYTLALGLMVSIGIFSSLHGMASVTSLQLLVPDQMRGRVMGVHSVTYTIPTLGAMPLGAIANVIGAPIAVGISGLMLTVFALGPALANKRMRRLGLLVRQAERSRRNRV